VGAGWTPGRGRAVTSWATAAAAGLEATEPAAVFRIGDDVVHAAFGEGVVTGTDPGGVVIVRFSKDRSERRLMADYAPIKRR
jgi:DNA helicase-2/ATP-dependent DNA helicase PcrA